MDQGHNIQTGNFALIGSIINTIKFHKPIQSGLMLGKTHCGFPNAVMVFLIADEKGFGLAECTSSVALNVLVGILCSYVTKTRATNHALNIYIGPLKF